MKKLHDIILSTEYLYEDFTNWFKKASEWCLSKFTVMFFIALTVGAYWIAIYGPPPPEGFQDFGGEMKEDVQWMMLVLKTGATVIAAILTFAWSMLSWEWAIGWSKKINTKDIK